MQQQSKTFDTFIGVDVSKCDLAIHCASNGMTHVIANESEDIKAFFSPVRNDRVLVICEATGGYEANLLTILTSLNIAAHRGDGAKIKAFIRSLGSPAKTDHIDARGLAIYGRERAAKLPLWFPPSENQHQLQCLVMRRSELVSMIVAEKNRLSSPNSEPIVASCKAVIACLECQLENVSKTITKLISADEELKAREEVLLSISGIGNLTAAKILALMPELGHLNRKTVASLAGLAPHPHDSGKKRGYRKTRGGRKDLRTALYMAALAASQSKSPLGNKAREMKQRGKKPIVVITAIMRIIITIANARIRDYVVKPKQS